MSEETEVKSKQELIEKWELEIGAAQFYEKEKKEKLISYMKDFVSDLNQLDEPETLSIDKEELIKRIEHYIPLHDKTVGDVVGGILEIVKQLPEMEVLSPEWIESKRWQTYDPDARTLYWAVTETDLENILVPKQEKVTIESVWAEDIEDAKESGMTLFKAMNWMAIDSDDKEKQDLFARAWLDGYTIEEEQKYYVVKSEGLDGVHYYFTKFNDEMDGLFTPPNDKKGAYRFDDKEKAQAIANYTDNKVEELEE